MTTPTNAWHTPARLETLLEQSKQWQWVYRPEFFRLGREEDQVRLGHLLESGTQMLVSDQLQGQLGELIKARRPRRTYSQADLNQEVGAWLAERPPAHYGVWVYYPWSGWLVHLLDEREFIELRTTRNLYKITAAEREVLAQKKIGIMGLSVGQSIALTVAMERSFGEIRLADFDLLELSNLNRIRSGVHTLGISKVVVAAREIAEIDPFLRVTCFLEGVNEENLDQFLLEGGRLRTGAPDPARLDSGPGPPPAARPLQRGQSSLHLTHAGSGDPLHARQSVAGGNRAKHRHLAATGLLGRAGRRRGSGCVPAHRPGTLPRIRSLLRRPGKADRRQTTRRGGRRERGHTGTDAAPCPSGVSLP